MPDFNIVRGTLNKTYGTDTAASDGTNIPTTVNNTKGSYTTIVASLDYPAHGLYIRCSTESNGQSGLLDIAIGAAASEVVIIANMLVSGPTANFGEIYFPIYIPAGTRISARYQSTNNNDVKVVIQTAHHGFGSMSPLALCTTYGANTSDSGGVSIDPGGTANTPGSWTQIVAATTYNHKALMVMQGHQANISRVASKFLFDVAIGAGGSEVAILTGLFFRCDNGVNNGLHPRAYGCFDLWIPEGTRLSVRSQCSITDATDRLADIVLIGVT